MKTNPLIDFIRGTATIAFLFAIAEAMSARGATLLVINTNNLGAGSLRQAILSANATTNVPDVINFNIPGVGPHTINPATPLPAVTDPIVIDGYSQPGASSNTLAAGDDAVLKIVVLADLIVDTTNSAVRGLAISQIHIGATPNLKGSNVVEGCFVGLDPSGSNSLNSPGPGVFAQTPNNRIGGTNAGARNIISGQGGVGIEIFESFASNNVIQGNFIGTDRSGTTAIGNTNRAVVVNQNASRNTIGGSAPGAGNLISGNFERGITLDGSNNIVQGNFIGTDVTGLLPLGNGRTGVEIGGAGNLVGGGPAGAANIIAFNGVDGGGMFTTNGIDVKAGTTSFTILGNSIHDNLGLGIDVNANGVVTAGYPVITVTSNTTTGTVIKGTFMPNVGFLLQLFTNPTADPSGFGEGKTLLFSSSVPTDAGGNFTVNLAAPVPPGLFITATANGNTEFSQARMVIAAGSTNSWTNSVGGKWETGPNWSLNVPPYIGHSLVLITNAGSKTVSQDATTAGGFPSLLTISNLTISAPAGATNTLLLAHGGTNTPLRIFGSLAVSNGGAVVIDNAALSLQGPSGRSSRIDGALTLNDGSLTATNNGQLYIGSSSNSVGTLTVSNGFFTAYYPIVGINPGANGTWNIAGGNSTVTTVFDLGDSLTATGTVRMTGGLLSTPNIYVGLFGRGNLIVSNGTFYCPGQVLVASQPGSVGNVTVTGGTLACGNLVISEGSSATGTVVVAGTGQVYAFNVAENRSSGTIRMDGGTFTAANLWMNGTAQFIFNQGTLQTLSAAVSNAPFVVGDGTNAAVYQLFTGGTNSFSKGLRISNHATLVGEGLLVCMVTNSGVIDPSGNYSYTGEIDITGGLVLTNTSEVHFDIAGFAPDESDFLRTTGTVVLGGKLSVALTNDFQNFMTNGASFTVMTNTTIFTGAFTNVASGGLLTTSDGYARFTVLYAGARTLRLTNLQIVDSDGDGMPDWWEDYYGLDKNVADATADYDGDGASNIDEYRAGTQPSSQFSVFGIVALQRETNNMRITWTTVRGKSYRVQTNAPVNGFLSTNFADASPLIQAPTDDDESMTNFLHVGGYGTNVTARYYRIRLGP